MVNHSVEAGELMLGLKKELMYVKSKAYQQVLLNTLPLWILFFSLCAGVGLHSDSVISISLFISTSLLLLCIFSVYCLTKVSTIHQSITIERLIEHYNACFPELEHSSQLVFTNVNDLNALQKLQYKKIIGLLSGILIERKNLGYPQLKFKRAAFFSTLILLGLSIVYVGIAYIDKSDMFTNGQSHSVASLYQSRLINQQVMVSPPVYTDQLPVTQEALSFTAIVGSTAHWTFTFNETSDDSQFIIKFTNGEQVLLTKNATGKYQAKKLIYKTSMYRVEQVLNSANDADNQAYRSSLHTIKVTRDAPPSINIVTPKATITELSDGMPKQLSTKVLIEDDFALSKIQIIASIAKGTGEAVKFRDQTFSFDTSYQGSRQNEFSKTFDLLALGMEAGDELYFSIHVWDNREPEPQLTRSNTKIIRWLEEGEQAVLADGVLIDFMPEYFKSQRQIIIETKELIAEMDRLTPEKFTEISELLGVAQSELKEKYGQYLGDESESVGLHQHHEASHGDDSSGESTHHKEDDHTKDHHETSNHTLEEAASQVHEDTTHASDDFGMQGFSVDRSGLTAEMQKFGHNHGEADIGMMTTQDPKALMKRSLNNMWQAELYLMLSNPKKALPFELEALKYLKLAKKADRIYVKRLGFEPPPVSEQRRYQGELDEIYSYQQAQQLNLRDHQAQNLNWFYRAIADFDVTQKNIENTNNSPRISLTDQEIKRIRTVKHILTLKLEQKPHLIEALVVIEKVIERKSFLLVNCQDCLFNLQKAIWALIVPEQAKPNSQKSVYHSDNVWLRQYQQYIEHAKEQ